VCMLLMLPIEAQAEELERRLSKGAAAVRETASAGLASIQSLTQERLLMFLCLSVRHVPHEVYV